MAGLRQHRWLLALAALGPVLLFGFTLGHGFILDDYVLFQTSESLRDPGSIVEAFSRDVGALRKGTDTVNSSFYRPVFLALSTLYYALAGGDPGPWHAAAVLLAGLLGAAACAWLLRFGIEPVAALAASLVFSLHPAHVSSVAWASGLQELLAALFSFLALLALLWREEQLDGNPIALASFWAACAMLSKEVGVALLPLVLMWGLAIRKHEPSRSRRLLRASGAFAAVTLCYLAARFAVLGALARPWTDAPSLRESLISLPVAVTTYLRLLVWPTGFSFFRPERPISEPLSAAFLLSVASLVVLGALAIWGVRRRREILFPVLWFGIWLLPVLNIWALGRQSMISDRYLFLPSLALPWLLALLLPRRPAVITLGVLAAAFALLSLRYAAIFRDERTFVAAMERAEPNNAMIQSEKARLLTEDGKPEPARAAWRRAVELDPTSANSTTKLAELELQLGDVATAEGLFRKALLIDPSDSRGLKRLALALARQGQRQRAYSVAAEAARRWPGDFESQLLHALFLQAAGDSSQAATTFERARQLRPGDPAVAGGLDALAVRLLPGMFPN